ncbi:hypothetical protein ACFGVS_09800 [Mucilaginibacter sp. AW1-7]|jgi:hypothetical protein|uniref:hypothetical protein n=1 Tax=unclassified Mucilaginibacter TaxID=2617802 RepID=UPI0008CF3450|nr:MULTISPECIES: hypothetical protein [unclassified Mucilaginibacter]WDF80094.1 hypothetical protein PQ469_08760 [Mucilaginibacter sp. KACC 22773]SEO98207.1 hypothetical protein SAMN05428947_105332 [Mucilaginibacter sp. OK283]
MKKIIIAIAIILTSGITAYSLNNKETKATPDTTKNQTVSFTAKAGHGPKADLGTAD